MGIWNQAELLESIPHICLEGVHGGGGRDILVGGVIDLIIFGGVLIRQLL